MVGTFNCIYETPCGWCSKWDKKCDKKIPERGQRAKIDVADDVMDDLSKKIFINKICTEKSGHEWECCGISTMSISYRCKKCGAYKEEFVKNTPLSTQLYN